MKFWSKRFQELEINVNIILSQMVCFLQSIPKLRKNERIAPTSKGTQENEVILGEVERFDFTKGPKTKPFHLERCQKLHSLKLT